MNHYDIVIYYFYQSTNIVSSYDIKFFIIVLVEIYYFDRLWNIILYFDFEDTKKIKSISLIYNYAHIYICCKKFHYCGLAAFIGICGHFILRKSPKNFFVLLKWSVFLFLFFFYNLIRHHVQIITHVSLLLKENDKN